MKKSTTRRALILSVLSLIMCASMLVGTTFAWFTDTVTSTGNKIVSGTLDVQLWMADANGNYNDISNSTDPIFSTSTNKAQNVNSDTLWEPGKTQVAYLQIKNGGNLALKYTVGLKVYDVTKDLHKAMQYTITPDAEYGDVDDWAGNGNDVALGTQSVAGNVSLLPGETHSFALSIHMKEEAGNEYQNGSITFDLAVLATQLTYESDSFNNQYDKDAKYDTWSPIELTKEYKTTPSATEKTVADDGAQTPKASDIVDENNKAIDPNTELTTNIDLTQTDTNDATKTFTYEISIVDENGNKVKSNGAPFIVPVEVGAGLGDFTILHKGVAMTSESSYDALDKHNEFYYDYAGGWLYIATCDFSPFEVTVSQYSTAELNAFKAALAKAVEGDTVTLTLTHDAYLGEGEKLLAPKGVNIVVNGNSHTIYADNAIHVIAGKQKSNLTINDVTVVGTVKDDAIISQNNGTNPPVVINMTNVTVNLDKITTRGNWPVCFGGNGTATLTNCTITGAGLPSGDYADGNVFFAGAQMDVTLVNTKLDDAMLNGSKGGDSATMKLDETSDVGLVYLEAHDPAVVTGSVENVGSLLIPVTTAKDLEDALSTGADVIAVNNIDMNAATVPVANGAKLMGVDNVTISNAHFTVADDNTASFSNIKFAGETTVEAKGDGALNFVDCEFNVAPAMYNNFSRAAAIIGANQYYTLDLYLENCTFNYTEGSVDKWNAAIFMWSNIDDCVIKNCSFNGYGFMAIKLMNAAEGANIVFEGNTFNMSKIDAANYHNNNAVQIMPQHDNALTVKFVDNVFTGDYRDGTMVAKIEVMHGSALTKLTFEQSGNTINGETVTADNFAINAQKR